MAMHARWLLCLLCLWCSVLFSQDDPLQRRISIHFQDIPLQHALKEIAIKGHFLYAYNSASLDLQQKVSLNAQSRSAAYCLQSILGKAYQLRSGGNHVMIIPRQSERSATPKTANYSIEGRVTDARTGKAIRYVSVLEAGQLKSTLTDPQGNYILPLDSRPEYIQLLVSRKSYRDTVIVIRPEGVTPVHVRLRPATIEELASKPVEIPAEMAENGLFRAVISDEQLRLTENLAWFERRRFQIGLLPTLGTNRSFGGLTENQISLNLLGGYAMALRGAELGGVFNITRREVRGLQIAGLMNITGGATQGVQLAGFMNNNIGAVAGVQMAGFYNLSLDSLSGMQLSGFFNMARGRVKGMQTAGFLNISGKELDGMQLSGFLNLSGREVDGVQVAGFGNIASGDFRGMQLSSVLNLSTGDMKGAQISGGLNIVADSSATLQVAAIANFAGTIQGSQISSVFNIAGKVGGSQLGLINVCDSVSGFTFGLISLVRKGYHKIEISSGDVNPLLVNFRTGTHRLYNIISAGMYATTNVNFVSFGYGLGTEFRPKKKVQLGLDVVCSLLFKEAIDPSVIPDLWARSNLYVAFQPVRGLQFFAGPSLYAWRIDSGNTAGLRPNVHRSDLFEFHPSDGSYYGWWGWQAGIRFF